jgi:hypothetical protein
MHKRLAFAMTRTMWSRSGEWTVSLSIALLGALVAAPAPTWGLTLKPTDCNEQRDKKGDISEKEAKFCVRRKHQECDPQQANERS